MRTILYARVSTKEQTLAHQVEQARQAGFTIDEVVADEGVSGITVPLAERPQGKRLFDLLRAGDMLVVRWVDRLGRDYGDVSDAIKSFMRRGVVVRTVINNMTFDGATTDPMLQATRDALIAFMAALSQAQAEATKEAQRAGIEYARAHKKNYLGRKPSYSRQQLVTIETLLEQGVAVAEIARQVGLTRQIVMRIRNNRAGADAALRLWGL